MCAFVLLANVRRRGEGEYKYEYDCKWMSEWVSEWSE